MLKFTILNGKVIVDTTILMRQEFVDILEYGSKGDKKDRANKLLLYVFYCSIQMKKQLQKDTPPISFFQKP